MDHSAGEWLAALQARDGALWQSLASVYGNDSQDAITARIPLLIQVLTTLLETCGDGPVRLFRAPGRINLRGMHVDTHGGYLNLMTHQREVVVAVRARDDGQYRF
ncbi:MAG: galactokinase family protein, partial [Candidatus Hydrogenedentes bacterium]|nr:galactokinase family protein [Candidatus Hydrogenedentota bacterium]